MSRYGLTYKGVEVVTPEEWNAMVDALNDLDGRAPLEIRGGMATFLGDGTKTEFSIPHGLSAAPSSAMVGKAASGLPDIDYWTVNETYVIVTFKSAPPSGVSVKIWWLAVRL